MLIKNLEMYFLKPSKLFLIGLLSLSFLLPSLIINISSILYFKSEFFKRFAHASVNSRTSEKTQNFISPNSLSEPAISSFIIRDSPISSFILIISIYSLHSIIITGLSSELLNMTQSPPTVKILSFFLNQMRFILNFSCIVLTIYFFSTFVKFKDLFFCVLLIEAPRRPVKSWSPPCSDKLRG